MFRLGPIVLTLLILLSTPLVHGDDATHARVDKLFASWDKPDTPGLALAVIQDGKTVYQRGYGLANLEYGVPISPSTVFHAASVSKQFTAFAIHLLAADGKLSLDDDVRKILPELQVRGPVITIRHLLHHTSGLRDQWELLALAGLRLDDGITEGDILGLLWQQRQLNFDPGAEELYSNSGYTLLGLIVKRVSKRSLAAFAQERIFEPLGMKNTHFHENYGALVPGRAYSYERTRAAGYRYLALSYSNTGATSLFTTVEDLARWDRNFYDPKVGGAALVAAMQLRGRLASGREITYASGLRMGRYRGQPVVEHNGADAGYRSQILRFPAQRLSVLLLGNTAELNVGELSRRVADIYLDAIAGVEPARPFPVEVELGANALAPYLGEFEMRPGFVLRFTAQNNQLMVQATGQPQFAMFASADNRFFTKAFEAAVTFDKAAPDGKTATAVWHQGGADLPLRRFTREPAPRAETLQACTGDFYSTELRTVYTLSLRGNTLMLRYPRGEVGLQPVSPNVFAAAYPLGTLSFERKSASTCDTFAISTGRVRNLRFVRAGLPVSAPVQ